MEPTPETRLELERLRANLTVARRYLVAAFTVPIPLTFFGLGVAELTMLGLLGLFGRRVYYLLTNGISHCEIKHSVFDNFVCGHCHHENKFLVPERYTFIETCRKCGRNQYGIICRECRQPIPFQEIGDTVKSIAWFPDYPPVPQPAPKIEPDPIPDLMDEELKRE